MLVDGLVHWIQWTERPILDEHGKIVEYQSVGRDISESKHLEEELRYLSTHDALTGLYNRAFFEAELSRLQRSREVPISILMADVNGLKNTNDTLGHPAGDELLKRAAGVLASSFRPEDIVARFGGDEFAVLLPKTDAAAAEEILLRVRANLGLSLRDRKIHPLSLSVGIATGGQGDSLLDVLNLADQHMYKDKQRQKKAGPRG
jgi:diguanylate cyclase (GGDEF)-like protein